MEKPKHGRIAVLLLAMETSNYQLLHHCNVHKLWATINRTYAFFHIMALVAIFYFRGAFFFNKIDPQYSMIPFLPWLVVYATELLLSFLWLLKQPFYWRPVTRTALPERLPKHDKLPGIDVFICTADPEKEPTLFVMNTIISAMAMEYPVDKLSVYLSDDAGASVTLNGMKEAWGFATWWLPFCSRYNIKPTCPQAYFLEPEEESQTREFLQDRKNIEAKYEAFKQRVENWTRRGDAGNFNAKDHPAIVQVVDENSMVDDAATINPEKVEMPTLVYVSREKRPSQPHHFKAGALNALLRVSSALSNSPYILVLDCDMYCNDSISARQAMCFFLDPKISPTLGWVQYPQKFRTASKSDIYDSQLRLTWTVYWPGADGLQGPLISGTNFYIKRKAIYGFDLENSNALVDLRRTFEPSNEFINSLSQHEKANVSKQGGLSSLLLKDIEYQASCTYEQDTKWGDKVGFLYRVQEDLMTATILQSRGWRSVYLNPLRPQFLGSAPTNLNDYLIQNSRWTTGLVDVGLSRRCPLFYSSSRMQLLQRMCNSWIILYPFDFIPVLCFAIVPPICFIHGIPLYPTLSDPFIIPFAFAFFSSRLKHLCEVYISGGTTWAWFNEQRIWMIKSVTCYVYGTLDSVMTKLGLREASFIPTNKTEDGDKTKWYYMGKYDFRTSDMLLVPLVTVVILNLCCFVGGLARIIVAGDWNAMFAQFFFSFYVLLMSFPVIHGMSMRMDSGRIALSATFTSIVLCAILLSIGYI